MDRADLAIKMSKLVHDKCKDVPHDIGLQLLYLIEEYDGAFRQPLVSGSVCPDCLMGRDEFEPDWKCPECRRQTDR